MTPETVKTLGYGISCVSVFLLGAAAFPGASKAGLLPALFAGMATSILGMGMRWCSYELEKRQKAKARHAAPPSPPRGLEKPRTS